MSYSLHLRSGTYYLRLFVPSSLHATLGKREIWKSLQTGDKLLAGIRAAHYLAQYRDHVDSLGQMKSAFKFKSLTDQQSIEFLRLGYRIGQPRRTGSRYALELLDAPSPQAEAEFLESANSAPDVETLLQILKARSTATAPSAPFISVVITDFLEKKRASVGVGAINDFDVAFRLLVAVTGDMPIDKVSPDHADTLYGYLKAWPVNLSKHREFNGRTPHGVVELNKKLNLPTISDTTINKYLVRIKTFFNDKAVKRYVRDNPFSHLEHLSTKRAKKQVRDRFTEAEIALIFNTETYPDDDPAKFFIPLIGLYSGARLNEICQLYLDDIGMDSGIYYFNFNQNDRTKTGRNLKGYSSHRFTPIHSKLIELGFLDYVADVRKLKLDRVFPHLPYSEKSGFGRRPSYQFGSYLTSIGMAESTKVFHSFRHTFNDSLKQLGIDLETRSELSGHEISSTNSAVYTNKLRLGLKRDAVEKLTFDIKLPKYQPHAYDTMLKKEHKPFPPPENTKRKAPKKGA